MAICDNYAAATGVVLALPKLSLCDVAFTPQFEAEHLFVCLIRDNSSAPERVLDK